MKRLHSLLKLLRYKIIIVFFIFSSISLSFFLSFTGVVNKFLDKEYYSEITIEIDDNLISENYVKFTAVTVGDNTLNIKSEDGTLHFGGTYIKNIYMGILESDSLSSFKIVILNDANGLYSRVDITPSNLESVYTEQGYMYYDIVEFIEVHSSMIPFFNKIINWVGDQVLIFDFIIFTFLWFISLFIIMYLLFFIFIPVRYDDIKTGSDFIIKEEIFERRDKYYLLKYDVSFFDCFFYVLTLIKFRIQLLKKNIFLIVNFVIILVIDLIYIAVVFIRNDFSFNFVTFAFFTEKILIDFLLYYVVSFLLFKIRWIKIASFIFSTVYVFFILADTSIYYFGNTVLEKTHFKLITVYSIMGFMSFQTLFLLILFAAVVIPLNYSLYKSFLLVRKKSVLKLVFLLSLFIFFRPLSAFTSNIANMFKINSVERLTFKLRDNQLKYASQNSMINLLDELFLNDIENKDFFIDDYSEFSDVIDHYNLPLGKRNYSSISDTDYKRIVLFTTESLSLDFFSLYNTDLDIGVGTFYNSEKNIPFMHTNYRTSAHNTLEGLIVTFNSHINHSLLKQDKGRETYQNSLARILKQNGYRTVFLRSASRYYANENIHFKNLGFDQIIAREDFEKDYSKYVENWGVFDRIMYDKLVDLLINHRDEKIFITVLGTDTHPLDGRINYKDLEYLTIPDNFKNFGESSEFMRSVYYHDYDIQQTINRLKDNNLIDDQTLLIFTADHACPVNNVTANITGYDQTSLARIPLMIMSNGEFLELSSEKKASQLDLAPTILHLLNIDIPQGYWGNSLFSSQKEDLYIGFTKDNLYIEATNFKRVINTKNPDNKNEKKLIDLYNKIIR